LSVTTAARILAFPRATSADIVPVVEMFLRFAAEGLLALPSAPAAQIADYLDGDGHARFTERRYEAPPSGGRPA
jgi:hypothetical protein